MSVNVVNVCPFCLTLTLTKPHPCVSVTVPATKGIQGSGHDLWVQDDDVIKFTHFVISAMSDVIFVDVMSDDK